MPVLISTLRCFAVFMMAVTFFAFPAYAEEQKPVVHLKIEGEIEHGVAAYLNRALQEADAISAQAVIVEINTPGGRLDSALSMKDALLDSPVRTIAYIKRHAYSAGALIALAAQDIYIVEGGVIGAATPVGDNGQKGSEKIISGTRTAFAATAEHYGRDPKIAEAMVDESLSIDGVSEEGKLLTLTANKALELKMVNGVVSGFEALLEQSGLSGAHIEMIEPQTAEEIVRFITSPLVSSLLLTLAMLALFAEFKAPGLGLGGLMATLCYALFFWGHHLAGLAGWEDAVLVLIGITLIVLEVFVIPGFGIFGILGIIALLGGFYISLVGDLDKVPMEILLDASGAVSIALIGAVILMILSYRFFFNSQGFDSGIVLNKNLDPYRQDVKEKKTHILKVGEVGTAQSDLRPSGTALFGKEKHSVSSDGDFIEAQTEVEIIKISGSNITVRIKS